MFQPIRAWRSPRLLAAFALAVFACVPTSVHADFIFTGSGTDTGGNTVDAKADFSLSGTTLTVTLTNLQTDIVASNQTISGIEFEVSNPPAGGVTTGSNAITLNSVAGDVVTVTGTTISSPTYTTYSGGTLSNSHWAVGTSNGLTALSGGQPNHMILGPGNGSTFNSGVQQFSPYFQNAAAFVLTVNGMDSTSTISNVTFLFGTAPDGTLGGNNPNQGVVPVPPSIVMLSLGGLGMALGLIRSRRRLAAGV